jgi:arginase
VVEIQLIGVPFDGYGRSGNQALAADGLRRAGLAAAFADSLVRDTLLDLPAAPDPRRGADTGLLNETALVAMVDAVADRVAAAVGAGRFPLVHGGDCSTLLGSIGGLRGVGLVMIDGHEDTMPLDVSEDGEAANAELGLLLGLTGRLLSGPLRRRTGVLSRSALAVLGPRDVDWRARFNVGTLRDAGVWLRDLDEVTEDPAGTGRAAAAHVASAAGTWWLHVDLDVLDPVVFPAQGLPGVPDEPGGLTWPGLGDLVGAALTVPGCIGMSVAIYDPEQDPGGAGASEVVRFLGTTVAVLH